MTEKRKYPKKRAERRATFERRWGLDEEVFLSRRWGRVRVPIIAEEMNRSTSSIIGKAKRMGLPNIDEETRHGFIREGFREWKENNPA